MESATPPGSPPRQGLASTSLGLGIASYALCLGPFAGIPAILTGHAALRRARRDAAKWTGAGRAITGMVLGYVSLLLGFPLIAVMLSLAMPKLLAARERAQDSACISNLKALCQACRLHADGHDHRFPARFSELGPLLATPRTLWCPSDTVRTPPSGTGPEQLTDDHVTYELLLPGVNSAEAGDRTVIRCPLHGHQLASDGGVKPGKAGAGRKKRDRGP